MRGETFLEGISGERGKREKEREEEEGKKKENLLQGGWPDSFTRRIPNDSSQSVLDLKP